MEDTRERDEQALKLRMAGRSFAGIAEDLGSERKSDAVASFNRALRRKPKKAREAILQEEMLRLDALAEKIKARGEDSPERTRRLQTVDRLRTRLLAP